MKLTTKMRYGTRAMLDLALHEDNGPISLREIARRQDVSPKYMEQLLGALQNAGLIRSARGPRGGYTLAQPPAEINLRQLYAILEGSEEFVDCLSDPGLCERSAGCVTQEVWAQMCLAAMDVLESTTLSELAERARQKGGQAAMYHI